MKSLANLFRYGPGPSSSHTIAPFLASKAFLAKIENLDVKEVEVVLYGSLALACKGHHTDEAIADGLSPIPMKLTLNIEEKKPHPLTMRFIAKNEDGKSLLEMEYISLGGGALHSDDDPSVNEIDVYPFSNLTEIKKYVRANKIVTMKDFCRRFEPSWIDDYLMKMLKIMIESVERGLKSEGKIRANDNPRLQLKRTAKSMHREACKLTHEEGKRCMLISSYAYAVAEGSSCGEMVVTAPTCGSSGVLPGVLYYLHKQKKVSLNKLRDCLYAAGMLGNVVKQNASIAGSVGGCQAEIGVASAMAACAICGADGLSFHQMEYAAECALEHFLGLTCDPVDGFVIIPCIERNGVAALRAYDSYFYAKYIAPIRKNQVSFDDVVAAMKITGDSLSTEYKETAIGGLASVLKGKNC